MPRQLDLPDALAAEGLTVEVVPGWETRGSAAFNPKGAVVHWTAGPRTGDRPSLHICTHGRPGLPGPLCNAFLPRGLTARQQVVVVVAAGRANHAGSGGWQGLRGNSSVFGTEAESAGPGDWTPYQRWAYPRVNAAYCRVGGFGPDMVCGHHEWATPRGRKVDVGSFINEIRPATAQLLTQGDDEMTPDQFKAVMARFDVLDRVSHGRVQSNKDVVMGNTLINVENLGAAVARVEQMVAKLAKTDPAEAARQISTHLSPLIRAAVEDTVAGLDLDGVDETAVADRIIDRVAARLSEG